MQKRIAVCINENIKTPVLLRAAHRKAQDLRLPWVAVYVETPKYLALSEEERERILRFLTMAEQMGAEIVHLPHKSALAGVVEYVENSLRTDAPIYHVIAGRSTQGGGIDYLKSSFAQRLAAKLKRNWEVHIIPLCEEAYENRWRRSSSHNNLELSKSFIVLACVTLAMLFTEGFYRLFRYDDISLPGISYGAPFYVACLLVAVRLGFSAALLASILSVFTLNYFYTSYYRSFEIEQVEDVFKLVLFFLVAVTLSAIGAAARWHAETATRRERRTQALFQINRLTANAQTSEEAMHILHRALSEMLEMDVAFFLPPALIPDAIEIGYPLGMEFSMETRKALEQCWREKKPTGVGTPDRYHTTWRFEPMLTHNGEVGVMGVNVPPDSTLDVSFGRLAGALADHCAAIIERVELARSVEATKIRQERERLRSMLLSSVSHDLKTPLASVIGSLSVYHSMRDKLPEERLMMLTRTALEEAQRLDSFITNILDMTRLESGDIVFKREWIDPMEMLLRVRKRIRPRLREQTINILPMREHVEIEADVMMSEQVLQNLLDNAIKYSPSGSEIDLGMRLADGGLVIEVRDRGKGIPEDKHEHVFDKYSRLKMEDSRVAGTGLGLAISRSIMESQEGTIRVSNHPDGGAIFTLFFPTVRIRDASYDVRAS